MSSASVAQRLAALTDDQLVRLYRDLLIGSAFVSDAELRLAAEVWNEVYEHRDRGVTDRLLRVSGDVLTAAEQPLN